ncbi:MAG TPA: site-2 protease family protein, partial [Gemmatimonadaceae bacterium]|nr:site-2 protease family protein [Gemmatimonadaceae bacterium]
MTVPSIAPQRRLSRCAQCGTEIAPGLLACPACGALVHAAELKTLAADAERQTADGDLAGARRSWLRVLDLLPPHAEQRAPVEARASELARRIESTPAAQRGEPADPRPWWKRGAAAVSAAVLLALSKAKFLLLGLGKMTTLASMLAFAAVYWNAFGWTLALGFVATIYVHEMGHVAALRRYGMDASAPLFVPGLGAVVLSKQHYDDPKLDAKVGLAGPLWGLGAGLVCYAVYRYTGNGYWGALAQLTGFINLFNLIPFWQLDGSRGFHALSRWQRWAVAAAFGIAFFATGLKLLVLLAAVAVYRAFQPAVRDGDLDAFGTFLILIGAL